MPATLDIPIEVRIRRLRVAKWLIMPVARTLPRRPAVAWANLVLQIVHAEYRLPKGRNVWIKLADYRITSDLVLVERA